jgi:hypothetical protein
LGRKEHQQDHTRQQASQKREEQVRKTAGSSAYREHNPIRQRLQFGQVCIQRVSNYQNKARNEEETRGCDC